MFLHLSAMLFTGGCIPACNGPGVGFTHPLDTHIPGHSPWTHLWTHPPVTQPWTYTPQTDTHTPLDRHPFPVQMTIEADGTHPSRMHSC